MSQKQNQSQKVQFNISGNIIKTVGEKLYSDGKKACIRELVQNSWDGDAVNVYITIFTGDMIIVEDDGRGMDEEGIDNYTNVGISDKEDKETTPIFERPVIGEFGFGKFAAFNLGERFELHTKQGEFEQKIVARSEELQNDNLEGDIYDECYLDHDGTKVIIDKLSKEGNELTAEEVKSKLMESCAGLITADNFNIYVNDELIELDLPDGEWYDIHETHNIKDWEINGKILIADTGLRQSVRGIQQQHKGMTIESGYMELYHYNHITQAHKLYGRVSADFVDITAGRDEFMKNTKSYKWFYNTTRDAVKEILKKYRIDRKDEEIKEDMETLKDVLSDIKDLIDKNNLSPPEGNLRVSPKHSRRGKKGKGSEEDPTREEENENLKDFQEKKKEKGEYDKIHISTPTENRAMSELIKDTGLDPDIEPLGEDEPAIIYDRNPSQPVINMLHPLYTRAKRNGNEDLHQMRLLTRVLAEINAEDKSEAFNKHDELLTEWISKQ